MSPKFRPFLIGVAVVYVTVVAGVVFSGGSESPSTKSEAAITEERYREAAWSRGQQLGKAFAQYASAHGGTLPDLYHSQEALKPYLPAEVPVIKIPFVPLLNLSQKTRSSIPDATNHLLFYEALDGRESNAPRVVGLVNGDVRIASPDDWAKLCQVSGLKNVPNVARNLGDTKSKGTPTEAFFFALIPLALLGYGIAQTGEKPVPSPIEDSVEDIKESEPEVEEERLVA
jgi:hypothetical protein